MTSTSGKKYILNQDKTGRIEVLPKSKFNVSISKTGTVFSALKGDLFEEFSFDEQDVQKIVVVSVDDNKKRLETEKRFLHFLDEDSFSYLSAVPSANERWEAFSKKYPLEYAQKYKVGDKARIRLRRDHKELVGTIRYIGPLAKKNGTYFGVEFQEPKGNTDGKDDGKPLFTCAEKHGLFVPLSQIIFCEHPSTEISSKSGKDSSAKSSKESSLKSSSQKSRSQGMNVNSNEHHAEDYDGSVRVDSRVVAFVAKSDGQDKQVRGIVRYIGRPGKNDKILAGIELDTDDGYARAIYKDQELFKCQSNRALIVPVETVIEENTFEQGSSSQSRSYSPSPEISFDSYKEGGRDSPKVSSGLSYQRGSIDAQDNGQLDVKYAYRDSSAQNYTQTRRRTDDVTPDFEDRYDTSRGNQHHTGCKRDIGVGYGDHKLQAIIKKYSDLTQHNPSSQLQRFYASNATESSELYSEDTLTSLYDLRNYNDSHKLRYVNCMFPEALPFIDNHFSTKNASNTSETSSLYSERPRANLNSIDKDLYMSSWTGDRVEQDSYGRSSESTVTKRSKPYDSSLQIDSVVEVTFGGVPHHGVIKWIGQIPSVPKFENEIIAGIELDEPMESGASDGRFLEKRYFTCPPGRGLFVKLSTCKKDSRFTSISPSNALLAKRESPIVSGNILPTDTLTENFVGKERGIQGHHNSCYMDAALFAMFSYCSVFDTILHRKKRNSDIDEYDAVQKVLKEGIVNPLRRHGYVSSGRVLELRRWLDKLGSVPGFLSEEKDPEEFLTLLLKDVLKADPFMKLRSQQHDTTDPGFLYQIVVEKDENNPLPSVQYLVEQSFANNNIRLSEIPSVLVLQLPRFGTQKIYKRIYLNQELNVTPILRRGAYFCLICGNQANVQCKECTSHFTWDHPIVHYCNDCYRMAHLHQKRKNHKDYVELHRESHRKIQIEPVIMELFAVVCIKTSHYVTFAKCGERADSKWVFFDSMADRQGGEQGHNIPEVSECPEVKEWICEGAPLKIAESDRTNAPERILRLLEDGSLCFYRHSEVALYR